MLRWGGLGLYIATITKQVATLSLARIITYMADFISVDHVCFIKQFRISNNFASFVSNNLYQILKLKLTKLSSFFVISSFFFLCDFFGIKVVFIAEMLDI